MYWRQIIHLMSISGLMLSLGNPSHLLAQEFSSDSAMTVIPSANPLNQNWNPSTSNLSDWVDLEQLGSEPMAQITNVSTLRDVSPQDWAYQALQSLAERLGCLSGYPDGTYRGNRPLTRYEFAAGLDDCISRYEREVSIQLANASPESALQRLQEEFALELALLRGDTDAVQARVGEVELNQFSTTTKLSGLSFWNVTEAFADGDILAEGKSVFRAQRAAVEEPRRIEETNTTFSYLTWLTFRTSFTGQDTLVTQLAAGNGDSPANTYASAGLFNTFGVPYTDQTAGVEANDVAIRELYYQFPVSKNIQVAAGPRVNWYRYFDENRFTFFLNGASSFNSSGSTLLNPIDRGSGAVVLWNINDRLGLHVGYLGEEAEFLPSPPFNTASNPDIGLFDGTNTLTAELTYSPSENLNLRFLYNRTNFQVINGQVGGAVGEPIYGFADYPGGELKEAAADTFSVNFDWLLTPGFGIFGRYGYGSTTLEPADSALPDGEINAQALQIGIAFPDLFKEGALATVSYLIPFSILDGREFLVSGAGDGGVQYEVEATYYYPLSDNLALVPAFYWIGNANNFSNNPNLYIANFRAQFSF
jgi:hypothetical protein